MLHYKQWVWAVFLFVTGLALGIPAGAEMCIVQDGAPQATIVVPEKKSGTISKAAGELQKYIQKMSGATLPIQESTIPTKGNIIMLGTGTVDAIKPTAEDVGYDGFILKTDRNKLIIAGRIDEGVLFGVYDLLERLGCRFYMPREIGEVVPSTKNIVIPDLGITSKPAVPVRQIYCWPDRSGLSDWKLKMRDGGPDMWHGHAFDQVVPAEKYFSSHPEYFPEITEPGTGKKRRVATGQRCISNPEVIKLFVVAGREYFDKNPTAIACSVSTNDGGISCGCQQCTSLDGPNKNLGNRYLWFANKVAEGIEKTHPGKYVAYYAQYLADIAVPEGMKARENVIPIVVGTSYFPHPIIDNNPWCDNFRTNMEKWPKIARQIGHYEWFGPGRSGIHSIAGPDMAYLLQFPLIKYHLSICEWDHTQILSYYISAKMTWDRNFDYKKAMEEFYVKFYGPASGPMKEYYDTLAKGASDFLKTLDPARNYKPCQTYMQELPDPRKPGMHLNPPPIRRKLSELLGKAKVLATEEPYRRRVELITEAQEAMNLYVEANVFFEEWASNPSENTAKMAGDSMKKAISYLREIAGDDVIDALPMIQELKNMKVRIENGAVGVPGSSFASAQTQASWDDKAVFGDLWSQYKEVISLPEVWKFKKDPKDEGVKEKLFLPGCNDSQWVDIKIREFWGPQLNENYEGYAWYRGRFKVPDSIAGKKIYLAFGAVDESAWVYLNGKEAGVHDEGMQGWDKRFLIDVTSTIAPGKENLLAVRVLNLKQAGGIWKSVKLISEK